MIIFKTFLKVLNKCKIPVIIYTACLVVFGGLNIKTNDSFEFEAEKPDVLVICQDKKIGITKHLVDYIELNSNVKRIQAESVNDALFYRDINYVIYIPDNYRDDFLAGLKPQIEIKSTGDYVSSLANMLLVRYLKLADFYYDIYKDENVIISKIDDALNSNTEVSVDSKLNVNSLNQTTFYYNFLSYSMMAGAIYVICLVLSSFRKEHIRKRIIVSSMNYKKQNRILLFANILFALVLLTIYIILSFVLCGQIMFSYQGFIYIINALIFTLCCVTLAFFISNLISNKNAINGIVNVVALGSSFLCGAFVSTTYLPDFVLNMAHILPTYWYINSNELLTKIEVLNFNNLKPIFTNMFIIILFSIVFIILSNIVSKKKQKID